MGKKLSFGFSSIVTLGGVVLLALVVVLGVYLVGQKVGFKPRASEVADVKGKAEAASLKRANLGLFISPTLVDLASGKVNLQLKWNTIQDPKFLNFSVSVYNKEDYSVVLGGEEVNVGTNTTWDFKSLPVKRGSYYVHLKAVFSGGPKLDRGEFTYYSFNPTKAVSEWGVHQGAGGQAVASSKGWKTDIINAKKPGWAFFYTYLDGGLRSFTNDFYKKARPFDIAVTMSSFTAPTTSFSRAMLNVYDTKNNSFIVGQIADGDLIGGTGIAGFGKARMADEKILFQTYVAPTVPAVFRVTSMDGRNFTAKYNDTDLTLQPYQFGRPSVIMIGVQNFKPGLPDISGTFSNFSMAWSNSVYKSTGSSQSVADGDADGQKADYKILPQL